MGKTGALPDPLRRAFAAALQKSDATWGDLFGDDVFYDLNYSDLFLRMWLSEQKHFRKTELYPFMYKVSHRTAVKYVQLAIDRGLLQESTDPTDRRARLISMSPTLRRRLERFIDASVQTFLDGPFQLKR